MPYNSAENVHKLLCIVHKLRGLSRMRYSTILLSVHELPLRRARALTTEIPYHSA